jgi:AraC-like DNA-binding protein
VICSDSHYTGSLGANGTGAATPRARPPQTSDLGRCEILAAAPSHAVRTHIADALRDVAVVWFATGVAGLCRLGSCAAPAAGLLYLDGSYDRLDAARWVAGVQQFRGLWRSMPLIGYAPVTPEAFRQWGYATQAGVTEIALIGWDQLPDVVGRVAESAAARTMAFDIMQQVVDAAGPLPESALQLVRYCVEHAREGLTVGQLATDLGLSRRTMAYRLRAAELPPPESLIMWGRLLVVAWLLRNPGYSVNQAARTLGWHELSALRSLAMSYLGHSPSVLREPGAVARVAMGMTAGTRGTHGADVAR